MSVYATKWSFNMKYPVLKDRELVCKPTNPNEGLALQGEHPKLMNLIYHQHADAKSKSGKTKM